MRFQEERSSGHKGLEDHSLGLFVRAETLPTFLGPPPASAQIEKRLSSLPPCKGRTQDTSKGEVKGNIDVRPSAKALTVQYEVEAILGDMRNSMLE